MKIIDSPLKKSDLLPNASFVIDDEMIKGVVDIKKEIIGIDADLHADIEQYMLDSGSAQEDLWGINLYPNIEGEGFVEFDSMINIRPRQNNRTRFVEDAAIRDKIKGVISKWLK